MQSYAIQNNLTPFISMQNHYNLLYREEEREMMPTLAHFGVGSIPWSPLARGLVTRPWNAGSKRQENDPWAQGLYAENSQHIVEATEKIAKARGVSMAQIALAWILSKDAVSAPIIGTTSLKNLEDLLGKFIDPR
jgi:aryl-alcohol dehydrogenase-like predicted oxidoreductase